MMNWLTANPHSLIGIVRFTQAARYYCALFSIYHIKLAEEYTLSKMVDDTPCILTADCTSESLTLILTGTDGSTYFRYSHPAPVLTKHEAAVCINRFATLLFQVREEQRHRARYKARASGLVNEGTFSLLTAT